MPSFLRWSVNAARAWGTLLIAYDLVENTLAGVYTKSDVDVDRDGSPSARPSPGWSGSGISDDPVTLLHGLSADVQQYRRVIRRQAPMVGLFNASLSAAGWQLDPRALLLRNAHTAHRGEMHRLLDAMIESAARAVPHLIKSIISTDNREALRWVGSSCDIPHLWAMAFRPSMTTAMANNLVVRCLINQGVLVEAIEQHGRWGASWARWSPVHSAAAFGQLTLLDYTLLVEPVGHRDGLSPVIVAARNGWPELIPPLVEHGFDAFKPDAGGVSALEVACRQRWSRAELRESFGDIGLRKCVKSGHLTLQTPAVKFRYTGPGGGWGTNPADANLNSDGADKRGEARHKDAQSDYSADGGDDDGDAVEVLEELDAEALTVDSADAEGGDGAVREGRGRAGNGVHAAADAAASDASTDIKAKTSLNIAKVTESEAGGGEGEEMVVVAAAEGEEDDLFGVEVEQEEPEERQPLLRALWNGFKYSIGGNLSAIYGGGGSTNSTSGDHDAGSDREDEFLVDPSSPAAVRSMCEFDVVDELSAVDFHKKYVRLRLPVLVRGALVGPEWDDLRRKWSRGNIVQSNPDVRVNVSTIPCGVEFAVAEIQTSIKDHIAHMDGAEAARGRRRGATRQELFDAAIAAASAAAVARDNERINGDATAAAEHTASSESSPLPGTPKGNDASKQTMPSTAMAAAVAQAGHESSCSNALPENTNGNGNGDCSDGGNVAQARTTDASYPTDPEEAASSFGAEVDESELEATNRVDAAAAAAAAAALAAAAADDEEDVFSAEEERLRLLRATADGSGSVAGAAAVSIDADGGQRLPPPRYIYAPIADISPPNSTIMSTVLPLMPSFVDRKKIKRPASHFYLGSAGSGAPMHYHSHSYNVLVFGRKRWVILPPRHALFSKQHIANWLETEYKALRDDGAAMECIQEPGDVLYIPEGWAHGVLNLDDSIGFSTEFKEWEGYGGSNSAAASAEHQMHQKKKKRRKKSGTKDSSGAHDADASTKTSPLSSSSPSPSPSASPERNHISLAQQNLMLEPYKVLEVILKTFYRDTCKGCMKKQDYVDRIIALGTAAGS